jgi:serine/threonine protein kinase
VRESIWHTNLENTDKHYAVKTISKMHVKKKPFLQKYIDQEIEIMRKLDHPNIVKH